MQRQATADRVERLDRAVSRLLGVSRTQAQRLIQAGAITVGDVSENKGFLVSPGAVITLCEPDNSSGQILLSSPEVDVIYADERLLVVSKPAGLVVHAGSGQRVPTLADGLLARYPQIVRNGLDPTRAGLVHRLDAETSGLLLVALDPPTYDLLQAQFRERTVRKTYLALVQGRVAQEEAAIQAPLGRDPNNRTRYTVAVDGRYARTEFRVLERAASASYLEVDLITGRTHQIRVHMASIGHPILGDRVYGTRDAAARAPRQMLHAWRLRFFHPWQGMALEFTAQIPADITTVLAHLGL